VEVARARRRNAGTVVPRIRRFNASSNARVGLGPDPRRAKWTAAFVQRLHELGWMRQFITLLGGAAVATRAQESAKSMIGGSA
jgi:hypothetical protein